MMFCGVLKDRIQNWLRDYDRLQYLAVILIYIQVAKFHSLFAFYIIKILMDISSNYNRYYCNQGLIQRRNRFDLSFTDWVRSDWIAGGIV